MMASVVLHRRIRQAIRAKISSPIGKAICTQLAAHVRYFAPTNSTPITNPTVYIPIANELAKNAKAAYIQMLTDNDTATQNSPQMIGAQ